MSATRSRKASAKKRRSKRQPATPPKPESGWLNKIQAAEYLGVSERWIDRRIERGEIPFHKFGKLIRFHRDDLDDVIAASRVEADQ